MLWQGLKFWYDLASQAQAKTATLQSEKYTIYFDIEDSLDMQVYKQLYSRFAYIAFRENLHVSTEA